MLRKLRSRSTLILIAAATVAVLVSGCSTFGKPKKPTLAYQERPVELLYSVGARAMDGGYFQDSILYFQEVERQHPYSE